MLATQLAITLIDFYLYAAIVGGGYMVIAFLLGHVSAGGDTGGHDVAGGHDMGGGGHDIGAHTPGHAGHVVGPCMFGPLSPLILALFLTCFGLVGWAAMRPPLSLGWFSLAPAGGLALALAWSLMWIFNKVFARAERTSSPSAYEMIGLDAQVITPIPADGAGEIAYVVRGARYNAAARSDTGCDLPRGTRVRIERKDGAMYFVAPVESA